MVTIKLCIFFQATQSPSGGIVGNRAPDSDGYVETNPGKLCEYTRD